MTTRRTGDLPPRPDPITARERDRQVLVMLLGRFRRHGVDTAPVEERIADVDRELAWLRARRAG